MNLLFGIGLLLLSFATQAEVLGVVCDDSSQLTFESDKYNTKFTQYRDGGDGVLSKVEADIIKKAKVEEETYRILQYTVEDLMRGDYYETEDLTFVIANSQSGFKYVFVKQSWDSDAMYMIHASSKQCRNGSNPFAQKVEASDLPISTLMNLRKSFTFTNPTHPSSPATSYIFKGGIPKIEYCRFERQGNNVAPLIDGLKIEVASIEKNTYSDGLDSKYWEIKLKFEKFGALSCFSKANILSFTIEEMNNALKDNGVFLYLPNEYLPEEKVSDISDSGSSFRLIEPIVIKAGTNQTRIGGSYGKIQACYYQISNVASESTYITSLGSIARTGDFVKSFIGNNNEVIEYSSLSILFDNGNYLYCHSFGRHNKPLINHHFLRALNADKPNVVAKLKYSSW